MNPKANSDDGGEARGIVRVVKNRDYSVINNTGLRDARLSFGARGVLAYLLSKPDNWQLKVEDLIRQSPQGEHAVRAMLRELKRFGYLKRERRAGKGGRFEWQTTIYEVPQGGEEKPAAAPQPPPPTAPDEDEKKQAQDGENEPSPLVDYPQMDNPQVVKPQMDKPLVENRPIYKVSREEELREERLSEGVREGESARPPHAPAPRLENSASLSVLQPAPQSSPELGALAREFNVNLRRPDERDVAHWADAVATIRDWKNETCPSASTEELIESVRRFKALWRDGGRRGNPYLSQVVAHWHRLMSNQTPPDEFASAAPNGADRVRRAREMAYKGR